MTTAIIPVKPLHESKMRLAHLLSPDERATLMACLLGRTLRVLAQTAVSHILVVSRDEVVLQQARAAGAGTLREERPFTLNSAVAQARNLAVRQGATGVLILPADLPFVQTADITALLDAACTHPPLTAPLMVICGDVAQQGTNGLLLTPSAPFTFHYGLHSFARHCDEAAQNGRIVRVVNGRSLQFDLDTEADWTRLQTQLL
jgi:2-phospho-L-lactate/phosphoenolpyruvate guanylyltransferase